MMKKIIVVVVSVLMVWGLAACGSKAEQQPGAGEESSVESAAGDMEENAADHEETLTAADVPVDGVENMGEDIAGGLTETEMENSTDTATDMETGAADDVDAQNDADSGTDLQESKVLVAYFSATNTTEGVAQHIANGLKADIYEIVPEEPYTDADLDYNDNNSRTTIEMNNPDVRPTISSSVENMEQYDIIFIGYPNWYYSAPMAVFSFLEENNLAGKKVVLFCSHGVSGNNS